MNKSTLDDAHSLSHTKWNCKYHMVFAPKYRRKAFYGERRLDIGAILRKLCEWKGVNILEAEVCLEHYVDTVGKNTKAIAAYIQNQLKEDTATDQ